MARNLSEVEVAQYAIGAGASGTLLVNLVAISFSENPRHDPDVTHTNRDGSIDTGIWQINSTNAPVEAMKDPAANAKKAVELANNPLGLRNWTNYKNGAYRLFYGRAATAVAQARQIGALGGIDVERAAKEAAGVVADPLSDIRDISKFFTVGRNWGRITEIALGGILLVVALNIFAKPVTEPLVKTAAKAGKLAA